MPDAAPDLPPPGVARPVPAWGLGEVAGGLVAAVVLGNVVTVVVAALSGWTNAADFPLWAVALLQLPLWAGWVGAMVVAGRKGNGLVADLGLRFGRWDWPAGLAAGVALQLVVVPLLYLPLLSLLGRDADDLSAPARELADRAEGTSGWLLLLLVVGIGAPLVEELFYRGLLMRSLLKRGMPGWAAVACSAAVFAALHLQPLQFVGLFVFGLVAGVLALRTGRLGPAVAAHVGFNVTTVVVLWAARGG